MCIGDHWCSEEHMMSIEDKISKGQCLSGKMHLCTHHNRFNCKHMYRACVNKIGVNVLKESGSHNHDVILENNKVGLPTHVKERSIKMLETNESITPKPLCAKSQVEEMNLSATTRKLVKSCLINLRKNRNKDAKLHKSTITGIKK